ncbi:MAG TPA: hypothetical protein VE959_19450 [Bryobacteraceae bacterium]|nr:hypothetical protein [Bryobacteraceae bacterium]
MGSAQARLAGLAGHLLDFLRCRLDIAEPHVKKGEKALTLCIPIQIKCKDWDQKWEDASLGRC